MERHTNKLKASKWKIIRDIPAAFQASLPPAYNALAAYGIADFSAALGLAAGGAVGGVVASVTELPAGWEQASDPKTGRPYFVNRVTGEAAWTTSCFPRWTTEPPPVMMPAEAMPLGWEQAVDPSTGRLYYVNRSTGQSKWSLVDRPPPEKIPDKEWLISEVKRLQRGDATVTQLWRDVCTERGNGTFDPSRHTPEFMNNFVKEVQERKQNQSW